MTLPSGNSQQFDILLNFALNEQLFDEIESKTAHIADETKRAQEMTRLYGEAVKKTYPDLYKQVEAEKQAAEAMERSKETAKRYSVEIRNLRTQARLITSDVRLLRDSAEDLDRIFKPLALGGTALVGGIFAFASKYVKDAEQATEATRGWKAAQEDLNRSGQRIGEVLAREALPLLQEAAKVTRQIAGFIESHPEAVRAALALGTGAAVVGTIGKLYTSGIRLVADLKLDLAMKLQNDAARLQLLASENQLRAAGIQAQASTTGGLNAPRGGVSNALALTGAVGVGAIGEFNLLQQGIGLAVKSGERFQQALVNMGLISEDTADKLDASRDSLYDWAKRIPLIGALFSKVGDDMEKTIQDVQNTAAKSPNFLGGSKETQDKIVQAFSDWKQADAQIVQDAMDARKQIVADGEKAIVDITRNYTDQRASIAAQFNNEAAQIVQRYEQETQKAEQDYQNDRAQIIKDGNDRIREIQQEEQEKREDIEREFAKASTKAAADRDALALVQAQETRDEALAEASRGTEEAIAKERQETQARLQELATRYAQERLQRQQQYEADLKENALRRAQALKEAAERYQAELKQAREATAQKLRDAAEAAQKERIEKRNQFIAQLADLGVTLNSERQLRNNAYNAMLADVTNWLNAMQASFANATQSAAGIGSVSGGTAGGSTTTTNTNSGFSGSGMFGTHDYSGYAYKGLYKMAQDGKPEWVLSGNDTRAAERAVGGQLTQQNVAQMIALMAAAKGSAQYVDNASYGKDMTTRQIRDLKEANARMIDKMLGGFG